LSTIDPPQPESDAPLEADAHVPTGTDYVSDRRFADFPVSPDVLKGIADLGYVTATPVQAITIEPALAGRDLLVRAKTGTGKTAAFCLPMIERAEAGSRKTHALVLAPTRELAQQIGEEFTTMAKYKDVNISVLVGGLAMGPQEEQLDRGCEIVVGTPGRILDHMRRGNLSLAQCRMVCLDEADEMLSMGFYEDVTKILDETPEDRQILLFSATISDETKRLADAYLRDPESIRLSTDADNVQSIDHVLYETTPDLHKIRALLFLLDIEDPSSAIIFCNTREDTATVASFLDRQGLDVQLLSGELSQARRSQVMKKVKGGEVRFLVSTDVAARGIDISDLSHVINYSLPQDPSVYLHRTGRTGRIGKSGTAISLVGGSDLQTRKVLETRHGLRFTLKTLPDADGAVRYRVERQAKQIRDAMGSLVFESYLPTVRALKERPDGEALLAAALRAFFQWDRQRRAAMSEVDSIGDLIQQRNEKLDRKAKRDRERSSDRDQGRDKRRRPNSRGERGKSEGTSVDELDALLVTEDTSPVAEAEADRAPLEEEATSERGANKKKKRRRRKKGGKGSGGEGESDSSLAADGEEGAAEEEPGEPGAGAGLDDLDALLTSD
jgi:ATP-dependent RNA helicase DeaD